MASLCPLPPIITLDSLVWDHKNFVVKSYSQAEKITCKLNNLPWAPERGRADNATIIKIQGSKLQPSRIMRSAHIINLTAPHGIFAMYQLETLKFSRNKNLSGKNIPPVKNFFIFYFPYCIKWFLLIPIISPDTSLLLACARL